ncbi:MYND-type domain-containing protein [Mycena venus]|uniref:MYND-type domain-containing protein n=1 Tax=Mycena venus TaxID=2733690 RepID=A0A8H6Y0L8_9AGAR|nr:MYND-type domain-containing protein [Mycena venus]
MPRRAQQVPSELEMPGVPDFRNGIAEWNAAWESLFPVLKMVVGDLELLTSRSMQLLSGDMQEELRSSHSILRGTHRTQEELRVLAVTGVLQPNFCWKTLTPAARAAHMLEGFLRCCLNEPHIAPNLRMYSCDITLTSLETENGEGFLALLRKYVPEGYVSLMEDRCISYLHPEWKEETIERLQRAGREAELQLLIVLAITDFLYNTILSIIGSPRPPEFTYTKDGLQSSTLDWGSWSKRLPNKKPNSESPNKTPVYRLGKICDGCRRSERDGDPRFMVCKKCNQKLSHKVHYCSRACQISHWPNHKKICGKELTPAAVEIPSIHTEASLADAVFLLERMGPARDGYTRSPALILQMQYLDAVPTRDYVFFYPTGPKPFMIPLFLLRLVLRLTVQTAICAGDRACIGALSEVVVECFQDDSSAFLAQFVAEFGDIAATKAKAVQAQLDSRDAATVIKPQAEGYTVFTPAGKLITRWKDEFVRSKVGSRYAIIADEPTGGPSVEVTRKVITDLREWWPRRS